MKIWAHRGCSQMYPENTLTAFAAAIQIPNLTGIELDIQLTRDGKLVVIHDEKVDRTTDGKGYVKDFTLKELKQLSIDAGDRKKETIPTMSEVFDLLQDRLQNGMLLNIELKNSVIPYEGMEQKILAMTAERGLQKSIVYSSFYAKSLSLLRKLEPDASIGMLDTHVSDCLLKIKGGCGATALHPYWRGIDVSREELSGYPVRAWLCGHLYPEKPTGAILDLQALEAQGITDVFLNEPERYL